MQKLIFVIIKSLISQLWLSILGSKWGKFWLILGTIVYFISPIDILPDLLLPILGYFDDGVLLWLVISSVLKKPILRNSQKSRIIDS